MPCTTPFRFGGWLGTSPFLPTLTAMLCATHKHSHMMIFLAGKVVEGIKGQPPIQVPTPLRCVYGFYTHITAIFGQFGGFYVSQGLGIFGKSMFRKGGAVPHSTWFGAVVVELHLVAPLAGCMCGG